MRLVLDTNIVLDWLVFKDARVNSLQRAWNDHRLELITHAPALDELRRVLAYRNFELTKSEQQDILECYQSRTRLVTLPDVELPPGFPRCRDCDDDHFLALAYHHHADGLVSKDGAVLELTKRAQKFGVAIFNPEQLSARLSQRAVPPP